MKSIFYQILTEVVRRYKVKELSRDVSNYIIAKEFLRLKVISIEWLKDLVFIMLGIFFAGFGLKGFLLPNGFIDGGVTGISLLTNFLTNIPLPLLIVVINMPFIVLGYFQISKSFVVKSIIAIGGLAIALTFINYPVITSDKLLIAVFGGFFLGAGIGLSVRGGAVLDGTEVLAIFLSRKLGMTLGDVILIFNIFIFSTAAYLLSIETVLYSILTYLSASKTVDFVIEGVEEYIGVTIISTHSDEIRKMIIEKLRRGVTIYQGRKGYGRRTENINNMDIIYSVITRLEITKLQTEIQIIDPNAFIVMNSVKDLKGGMIKKRQFKENE